VEAVVGETLEEPVVRARLGPEEELEELIKSGRIYAGISSS
jgi:hypothetical protein